MKSSILSTAILLSLLSCDRTTNTDTADNNKLPPITQTGANTAGCLVNGKILLPRGQKIQNGPVLASFYQYLNGGYHFGLAIDDNKDSNLPSIILGSDMVNFDEGKSYLLSENLNNNSLINSFGTYVIADLNTNNLIKFSTTKTYIGELRITHLDTLKHIISGTFWFDAVDAKGNKAEIREGRFDVNYAP
ncbi:hypothetical protein SAMN05660477_03141 [Soonwooa buanensis]|uniref:Lipoprotein n=1 Tax=Soonwooa buanensis TaxID=619805 RepID=A0A1T5GU15_9FLAO|nr:hypothetical protein [Soonwooa buanensis]SKC11913.1 hypothetical protein SAMN05660477_03141 [Soonwooa buanensis]